MRILYTIFIAEPYGSKVGVVSLIDDGKFDKCHFEKKEMPKLVEGFKGFNGLIKNNGVPLQRFIEDAIEDVNVSGICRDSTKGEILIIVKSPSVREEWVVDETKTDSPDDECYRKTFIHELSHAMDKMFEHCGVETNDTEVRAYTLGYMYMKCAQLIKTSIKEFEKAKESWNKKEKAEERKGLADARKKVD